VYKKNIVYILAQILVKTWQRYAIIVGILFSGRENSIANPFSRNAYEHFHDRILLNNKALGIEIQLIFIGFI